MSLSSKEKIKSLTAIQKVLCGLIVFPAVFVLYWFIGYQHVKSVTPPEGQVYPSAPVLEGIYKIELYSNDANSKVGDDYISCEQLGLGMYGCSDWGDIRSCCCLKKELNGKKVVVKKNIF